MSYSPSSVSKTNRNWEAILELCRLRCPKCACKLEESSYSDVRIDRCIGCGGVWLDPRELETLASEEHHNWLSTLVARMTGKGPEKGETR